MTAGDIFCWFFILSALQPVLRAIPLTATAFVPHYAMSDGTLIALAATEIEYAVLRPVDPQLGPRRGDKFRRSEESQGAS